MQITLKKVLFVGIGILCALFFFLVAVMPVSRTITPIVPGASSTTITGSLMGVLAGDQDSLNMVASQINMKDYVNNIDSISGAASAAEAYKAAVEALQTVYKVFAVLSIILFVFSLLALIGGFFMKSIRGTRKLGIPFLAIDIVLSLTVMIFAMVMVVSTDMIGTNSTTNTVGPLLMYLLGIMCFIGMLVASGVVKEKVLVGKKE